MESKPTYIQNPPYFDVLEMIWAAETIERFEAVLQIRETW